ncbi:MAG: TIGR03792 family protein [Tabrizicola sp.]|jgi:uncharacterized protein (TIGR03792 family)|nr:TIGR03792 family protein [Tabrizicola sp.]
MVIEELRFSVPPDLLEQFVSADDRIWTAALSAQAGFLGKEIWRVADRPDDLRIVIRWASRADWHAVPRDLLQATERDFVAALGRAFPVLSCTDLDVVNHPHA